MTPTYFNFVNSPIYGSLHLLLCNLHTMCNLLLQMYYYGFFPMFTQMISLFSILCVKGPCLIVLFKAKQLYFYL